MAVPKGLSELDMIDKREVMKHVERKIIDLKEMQNVLLLGEDKVGTSDSFDQIQDIKEEIARLNNFILAFKKDQKEGDRMNNEIKELYYQEMNYPTKNTEIAAPNYLLEIIDENTIILFRQLQSKEEYKNKMNFNYNGDTYLNLTTFSSVSEAEKAVHSYWRGFDSLISDTSSVTKEDQ